MKPLMPSTSHNERGVQPLKHNPELFANLPRPTKLAPSVTMTPSSSPSKTSQITPTTREKILELQHYQNEELSKLMRVLASKRHEVSGLRSRMMQLTTQKQELELDQEILHNKFYNSAKTATAREADLDSLDQRLELELANLTKISELHNRELTLNHKSRIHQLTKTFEDRVDETLRNKVRRIEEQKNTLRTAIEEQENKMKEVESTKDLSKNEIIQRYDAKLREVSDMISSASATLKEEHQAVTNELANVDKSFREFTDKFNTLQVQNTHLKDNVRQIELDANLIDVKINDLKCEIHQLQEECTETDSKIANLAAERNALKRSAATITEQFEAEEKKRRVLNNMLQDLKGNIRVFCRVRPPLNQESSQSLTSLKFPVNVGDESQEHVVLEDPKIPGRTSANKPVAKQLDFKFDKVFDMDSTNNDIFEEISPMVQGCVTGHNICLFAYGQTGSGKTYTMSEADIGMIPRTVHQIFEDVTQLSNLKTSPWEYQIVGKFLEIYNENLIDLISATYDSNRKHEIRHDAVNMKTTVTGLTEVILTGSEQVTEILKRANKNRSTASTRANERSSRSHSIFILNIRGKNKVTNEVTEGTLNLIDLAGSERLSNSQAVGDRLKETQSINKSLSALGDVISALNNKDNTSNHIPYRNSKLTYLLQYSLSGNSKTLMFVNVSPLASHFSETVNSLRFAMKVNNTSIC